MKQTTRWIKFRVIDHQKDATQIHPPHEPRGSGRESAPSSQSQLTSAATVQEFNARIVSENSLPGGLEPLGKRRKVCRSRQRLYFRGKPFARSGDPSGRRRRPARAERASHWAGASASVNPIISMRIIPSTFGVQSSAFDVPQPLRSLCFLLLNFPHPCLSVSIRG
jgi:hypothetical protein